MGTAPKQLEHLNEEIAAKNVEVKAAFEAYRSAAAATACAAIALTAAPSDKMLQLLRDAAQEEEQLLLGRHEDLKKDEDWLLQSSWYQRAKLPSAGELAMSAALGAMRFGHSSIDEVGHHAIMLLERQAAGCGMMSALSFPDMKCAQRQVRSEATGVGAKVVQARGTRTSLTYAGHCSFDASGRSLCAQLCTDRCLVACAGRSIFSVQYGSGREGLGGRSFTTRRTHTCERLFQLVSRRGYLLIQTPPQSGKSSTLQLLLEWARREHPSLEFTYINLSLVGSNFQMDDVLRARLGGTLGEIIKGECSAMHAQSVHWGLQVSCLACRALCCQNCTCWSALHAIRQMADVAMGMHDRLHACREGAGAGVR